MGDQNLSSLTRLKLEQLARGQVTGQRGPSLRQIVLLSNAWGGIAASENRRAQSELDEERRKAEEEAWLDNVLDEIMFDDLSDDEEDGLVEVMIRDREPVDSGFLEGDPSSAPFRIRDSSTALDEVDDEMGSSGVMVRPGDDDREPSLPIPSRPMSPPIAVPERSHRLPPAVEFSASSSPVAGPSSSTSSTSFTSSESPPVPPLTPDSSPTDFGHGSECLAKTPDDEATAATIMKSHQRYQDSKGFEASSPSDALPSQPPSTGWRYAPSDKRSGIFSVQAPLSQSQPSFTAAGRYLEYDNKPLQSDLPGRMDKLHIVSSNSILTPSVLFPSASFSEREQRERNEPSPSSSRRSSLSPTKGGALLPSSPQAPPPSPACFAVSANNRGEIVRSFYDSVDWGQHVGGLIKRASSSQRRKRGRRRESRKDTSEGSSSGSGSGSGSSGSQNSDEDDEDDELLEAEGVTRAVSPSNAAGGLSGFDLRLRPSTLLVDPLFSSVSPTLLACPRPLVHSASEPSLSFRPAVPPGMMGTPTFMAHNVPLSHQHRDLLAQGATRSRSLSPVSAFGRRQQQHEEQPRQWLPLL